MASNTGSVQTPIFDGENFDFWIVKMKTIFISLDLWSFVEEGYEVPENQETLTIAKKASLKDNIKKDAKALSIIQQGVTNAIFPRIMTETTAKEAWDVLNKEYRGAKKVRDVKLQTLRRDFESTKMLENEMLSVYFSRLNEKINQMKTYGETFTNQKLAEKILFCLPQKYDPIVSIIEETKDVPNLNIQELMGSIKAFDQRLTRHAENSVETAFQSLHAGSMGKGKNTFVKKSGGESSTSQKCNICDKNNHTEDTCYFKGKPKCYNCGKFNHVAKDCRLKSNLQANYIEEQEKEGSLF